MDEHELEQISRDVLPLEYDTYFWLLRDDY